MNRIKMVLSSLKTSILQPFSSPDRQDLPTHHRQELPLPAHNNLLQWQNIIMAFCFTSALGISQQYAQNQFQLPWSFHLFSLLTMLTFSLIFVANFISLKFPVESQVLEKLVVFLSVTTFFHATAISVPLSLKCVIWAVYVAIMLAVVILNSFF